MIKVTDVRVSENGRYRILSGVVDGKEAWYRFPLHAKVEPRGEPFLAYAIFLGQSRGQDILFDETAPLSPLLSKELESVQSILQLWNPEFAKVRVTAIARPVAALGSGVASSFSGGVDSSYTLVRHFDEISHLITLNNFDWLAGDQDFTALRAKNEAVAKALGKIFLPIETNVREVATAFDIKWTYLHGPFLCLLAVSLGFKRFYIPSTFTYRELHPWGSHPLLDPLWSTETTRVVHDGGEIRRSQKTQTIAAMPEVLDQLQVCWMNPVENCGICSKCARTQIVLNMLQVQGAPIPSASSDALISRLEVKTDAHAAYAWDIMTMARELGDERIAAMLRNKLAVFSFKKGLRQLKQVVGRSAKSMVKRGHSDYRPSTVALRQLEYL